MSKGGIINEICSVVREPVLSVIFATLRAQACGLASELWLHFSHPPGLEVLLSVTSHNGTQLLGLLHFGFPGESL